MIRNYLKLVFRHLLRNKSYSIINILGLAIGMACCIIILLYVRHELSYDQFFEDKDRIYRMALERQYPGRSTSYAIIPQSYAETAQKDLPEVEAATRIFSFPGSLIIREGENLYEEKHAVWADSNFFDVFSIPLVKGTVDKVLNRPNTVVLTESTARKYFGAEDPIGKLLDIPQNDNDLEVTGICGDIPENAHFTFDMVRSAVSLNFLAQANYINFSAYTYLLLKEGTSPSSVEAKFPELVKKYASGQVLQQFGVSYEAYQTDGNGYHYYLQALPDIYLDSNLEGELKVPGNRTRIYIFFIIAIFILLIACINFMNLATARSAERAKEVGIRKTLGSDRHQIALQFLLEAVAISLIATLIACALLQYLIPFFNNLAGKQFVLSDVLNWRSFPILLLLSVVVGLLAGSYPAIVISGFQPISVLKGSFWSGRHGFRLRNALVVFQFMISVILIISTIVVYQQLSFIQNKELGFNKSQVLSLQGGFALDEQKAETFKGELLKLKEVESVGGCGAMPGGYFFGMSFKPEGENEMTTGRGLVIDDDYIDCMQMEVVDGRAFSKDFVDTLSVILNESAVREMGLENPVGQRLTSNDNFLNPIEGQNSFYQIVGVVRDFHFQSLHAQITPLFFIHHGVAGGQDNLISVRLKSGGIESGIEQIGRLWQQFVPDQPFRFTFLDRDLAALYEAEQSSQRVFGLFSLLAIFIACMGLLGLAAYITQQRTKEIGIRKVLGASVLHIIALLSKDFLRLVLIALLIATPFAWWTMGQWLENFAYSIRLEWWIFVLAGVLAVFIAFATVSLQSVRAALRNPVNTLRDE